jgi:hypothetical protein
LRAASCLDTDRFRRDLGGIMSENEPPRGPVLVKG